MVVLITHLYDKLLVVETKEYVLVKEGPRHIGRVCPLIGPTSHCIFQQEDDIASPPCAILAAGPSGMSWSGRQDKRNANTAKSRLFTIDFSRFKGDEVGYSCNVAVCIL